MPGQQIDPSKIERCMVVFEMSDGRQVGWHVDQIDELGWDWQGLGGMGRLRVGGRFWRKSRSPESMELERRWAETQRALNSDDDGPRALGSG